MQERRISIQAISELRDRIASLWGRPSGGTDAGWQSCLGDVEIVWCSRAVEHLYKRQPKWPPGAGDVRTEAERLASNASAAKIQGQPVLASEPEDRDPDDPFQRLAEHWEANPPRDRDSGPSMIQTLRHLISLHPSRRTEAVNKIIDGV